MQRRDFLKTVTVGGLSLVAGLCLMSAAISLASCAGISKPFHMEKLIPENIEWCGIRHLEANRDALPRVLMVGDSITGAYFDQVAALLKDVAYCSYLTTSRTVCDPEFGEELELTLRQYPYAVIHFNNGIHGAPYSVEQYRAGLERAIELMERTCPKSTIIWATTTPINPEDVNFAKSNARIDERNAAALVIAHRHGIQINDLNSPVRGSAANYLDSVHFRPEISVQQAEQVAKIVRQNLK